MATGAATIIVGVALYDWKAAVIAAGVAVLATGADLARRDEP
jgi:hypothetical protein